VHTADKRIDMGVPAVMAAGIVAAQHQDRAGRLVPRTSGIDWAGAVVLAALLLLLAGALLVALHEGRR
jgi:hypothetical protein